MPYNRLSDFIDSLEKCGELYRVKTFVDPVLEIAEIADRMSKTGGKALLFENSGTGYPVLINAFGSEKRMAMALGKASLDEITKEIVTLFENLSDLSGNWMKKLSSLPDFIKISSFLPSRTTGKGICQNIITTDPDLSVLPILKCWPHDGGRFVTLPMVHTIHPLTGKTNVGMYRMQVLDKKTTAMHWQRHKTGANHFEAWKKTAKKMPVSVALGGDPVYTYSSTAPLPENFDEYILAGFLRRKKVKLVKCITNDLYVPDDADIIIEGYVDPAEELVCEGPFGDHTGFYSLADMYPKFHVTCITHSDNAVYPATVVGIPPMEDSWITKATEKIFLTPIKLALQPEIEDLHMPDAGVAHNLVIVKINKLYPGQGKKVISSLFGAGQMMFTKYLVAVSGDINIRNYRELFLHILENTNFRLDLSFISGPLDVLDHSSDTFSFGGKLGIDGTVKMKEELPRSRMDKSSDNLQSKDTSHYYPERISDTNKNVNWLKDLSLVIAGVNRHEDASSIERLKKDFREADDGESLRLIIAVDYTVDLNDLFTVGWQILANSDPQRDIDFVSDRTIIIDGTIKAFRKGSFPRRWPNIVCSMEDIIKSIDNKWDTLGIGSFIPSPSLKYSKLHRKGADEVIVTGD